MEAAVELLEEPPQAARPRAAAETDVYKRQTLISTISAAKPKIANYHFTTLVPTLGVVSVGEGASFVCAEMCIRDRGRTSRTYSGRSSSFSRLCQTFWTSSLSSRASSSLPISLS